MNKVGELRLRVGALLEAQEAHETFFSAVIPYVKRLKALIEGDQSTADRDEMEVLRLGIWQFYRRWLPGSADSGYSPPNRVSDTESTMMAVSSLVQQLRLLPEDEFRRQFPAPAVATRDSATLAASGRPPCVFIGHGGSSTWARVKQHIEDDLGITVVVYESEPRAGVHRIEILNKMLDQATFAVLVLTAEDEGPSGEVRARQNVVHEAGLFQGRLGFTRAILLLEEGCETFSNSAGLQHLPFGAGRVEQSFYELDKTLEREGQTGPRRRS